MTTRFKIQICTANPQVESDWRDYDSYAGDDKYEAHRWLETVWSAEAREATAARRGNKPLKMRVVDTFEPLHRLGRYMGYADSPSAPGPDMTYITQTLGRAPTEVEQQAVREGYGAGLRRMATAQHVRDLHATLPDLGPLSGR